jgi:hypothetical protein
VALLGMLFQLGLAIGHVDGPGPTHKDGLILATIEGLAADLAGSPVSHHDENGGGHGDYCPLCWLTSVVGSSTLPAVARVVGALVSLVIAWSIITQDVQGARLPLPYEIRGPPLL